MQLPAQEQSAGLFTVDEADCRRQSLRQVWLTCQKGSITCLNKSRTALVDLSPLQLQLRTLGQGSSQHSDVLQDRANLEPKSYD